MDLKEARELIGNRVLWPFVRQYLANGGAMQDFSKPENRMVLLDKNVIEQIQEWLDALAHAEEWKKVIDGETVRKLKESHPHSYPEVFRYLPYFSRFDVSNSSDVKLVMFLLKLKFPEAYELCYS